MIKSVTMINSYFGSLCRGDDLMQELTRICRDEQITLGKFDGIGAAEKAKVGVYNQQKKEYQFNEINKPLEIMSLNGNISLKDNEPFVHAHITLVDEHGAIYGGHLTEGTIVFVCEGKDEREQFYRYKIERIATY